jgi:hypothetical protein
MVDKPPPSRHLRSVLTPRLDGGPMRLNRRMERMIDLMIEGDPMEEPREPLDPYAAGKACGYQRKAVRELFQEPAFFAALEEKRRLFQRDGIWRRCSQPSSICGIKCDGRKSGPLCSPNSAKPNRP